MLVLSDYLDAWYAYRVVFIFCSTHSIISRKAHFTLSNKQKKSGSARMKKHPNFISKFKFALPYPFSQIEQQNYGFPALRARHKVSPRFPPVPQTRGGKLAGGISYFLFGTEWSSRQRNMAAASLFECNFHILLARNKISSLHFMFQQIQRENCGLLYYFHLERSRFSSVVST